MGARLLPALSESPPRLSGGLVEHGRLERRRESLQGGQRIAANSCFECAIWIFLGKHPKMRKTLPLVMRSCSLVPKNFCPARSANVRRKCHLSAHKVPNFQRAAEPPGQDGRRQQQRCRSGQEGGYGVQMDISDRAAKNMEKVC